jgi:uncharacterized protein
VAGWGLARGRRRLSEMFGNGTGCVDPRVNLARARIQRDERVNGQVWNPGFARMTGRKLQRSTRGALAILAGLALCPAQVLAAPDAPPPACEGHDLAEGVDLKPALARRADDLVNGDGLLWRIEKDGLAPSYLYGTIHTSDPGAITLAREAAKLAAGAKVVATELGAPLDPADKADMAGDMLGQAIDREHDMFAGAIPAGAIPNIEKYLAGRGYPGDFAHHMKMWFLAMMTSLPDCEIKRDQLQLPVVDDVIVLAGKDHGAPILGLESAKEQIAILASLPVGISATMLQENARLPNLSDDGFVTMLRLYKEKRPAEILAIVDSIPGLTAGERAAQDIFLTLMVGRNAAMAARAEPLLAAGGAFIAVGALHLPGKQGLIERFRAAGYGVSKVW